MRCREPNKSFTFHTRWLFIVFCGVALLFPQQGMAAIQGDCDNCHTMHNSQGSLPMRYDNGATPLPQLLRDDCYGCHAQGNPNAIYTIAGTSTRIPQVYHTDPFVDLAGGNFAYINGVKGGGASDAKGHNISGLASIGVDGTLSAPPGGISLVSHNDGTNVNSAQLQCAGTNGCHGNRYWVDGFGNPILEGITGAHHDNVSGSLNPNGGEMRPGHSYRFLVGVKGYEDTDWEYSKSSSDHNEYFALNSPVQLTCAALQSCHGPGGVRPPNGTMSQYCATCHGNFHTLTVGSGDDSDGNSSGVGTGISPFIRHPTDLSLPAAGEYLIHVTYNTTAPVARLAVPAGSSNTVTPGSDAVMCLSCHVAHASNYPDLLRWDYTTMDVGFGNGTGCFKCHTSK